MIWTNLDFRDFIVALVWLLNRNLLRGGFFYFIVRRGSKPMTGQKRHPELQRRDRGSGHELTLER
jgi:hypothetical protein